MAVSAITTHLQRPHCIDVHGRVQEFIQGVVGVRGSVGYEVRYDQNDAIYHVCQPAEGAAQDVAFVHRCKATSPLCTSLPDVEDQDEYEHFLLCLLFLSPFDLNHETLTEGLLHYIQFQTQEAPSFHLVAKYYLHEM